MAIERTQAEKTGLLLMLLESVVYGLYPVFTRELVVGADPIFVAAVVSIFASLPFLVILAKRGELGLLFAPEYRRTLLMIAFFATALANLCFFVGTAHSSGINASLLVQLEPLYSLILTTLFLGEIVTRNQLAATAILLIGAFFVLFQDGLSLHWGDLLLIITPLWYQLGHLSAKRIITQVPSLSLIAGARMLFGGLMLMVVALIHDPTQAQGFGNGDFMLRLFLFGILIVGLEKLIWYAAIKRIDLGKASALLVPSVAVGFLGSWLILGENPKPSQFTGLLLILSGLWWLARSRLVSPPESDPAP